MGGARRVRDFPHRAGRAADLVRDAADFQVARLATGQEGSRPPLAAHSRARRVGQVGLMPIPPRGRRISILHGRRGPASPGPYPKPALVSMHRFATAAGRLGMSAFGRTRTCHRRGPGTAGDTHGVAGNMETRHSRAGIVSALTQLTKAVDHCRKYILERAKGFEPSTPTLARLCSTPELHPLSSALALRRCRWPG